MMVKKSLCLKCAIEFSLRGDKAVRYEDIRMCCNNKIWVKEELTFRSLEDLAKLNLKGTSSRSV